MSSKYAKDQKILKRIKKEISNELNRENNNFIAEHCSFSNTFNNSSSAVQIKQKHQQEQQQEHQQYIEHKNAVDLTTARFRMLANAEDYARPFEAKVDNNLPAERYSNLDLMVHFSEIAYTGLSDLTLKSLIQARRIFRRLYFNSSYCFYFGELTINSPLLMYRLNVNLKPGTWIDQIIQWYPLFPNGGGIGGGSDNEYIPNDNFKLLGISQEKLSFEQHLKLEFREILLEYYEITDTFPDRLIKRLIELVEAYIVHIVNSSFEPFVLVNEICKKCGESFENKTDLINHHDFNGCRLSPVHRCQCGTIFLTHNEWQSHCFNVSMSCSAFGWHIWRHKRSQDQYSYMCDGCQHVFYGFLRFWNHCCCCPFFVTFLIGNCPFCTPQTKLEFYQHHETQQSIRKPHSDRVGITVIRDWAKIQEINFNIKLAIDGEPLFNF